MKDIFGTKLKIQPSAVELSNYTGQHIDLLDCCSVPLQKNITQMLYAFLDIFVTANSYQSILGLSTYTEKLQLIKKT